jgi:exodeoxyribonuclease V beta subunit
MRSLDPVTIPLDGPHLIEASAGTGKTYTIATLFVRLVVERDLGVDQILVVTFTEAAAAELRDRIRQRLRAAVAAYATPEQADPSLQSLVERRHEHRERDLSRLALALRAFDEAAISTIHGFCHRVLHDSAFETGVAFDTEFILDSEPLVDLAVRDFWARELFDADPQLVGYLASERTDARKLVRLARLALAHPRAPVIPEVVVTGDDPDGAAFVRAFGKAQRLWQRDRDEIQALLSGADGLKKNIYDPAAWPALFQAMDAFLRDAQPGSTLTSPGFHKFLPDNLADGTKKAFAERGEIPKHPFFEACAELDRASAPLQRNLGLRLIDLERRAITWVRRELPRRKRQLGVQSFDDLLHDLARALRSKARTRLAATIRDRYRAALVDEFQDTDPIQYEIFRTIYAGTKLPMFLIGDPKQAIYGFRGADVFAYVDAADAVGSSRYTMDTNWRSDPDLLEAIQHLFDVRRPFMLEEIGFPPVAPRPEARSGLRNADKPVPAFEILFARRDQAKIRSKRSPQITRDWVEHNLPALVAAHISELLDGETEILDGASWRPLHAGDIAVLVRKNVQAQQVQGALRRLGIPGVVYGDASVLTTRESDELNRVLAAAAEPTHGGFIRAAVTTELLGVTGGELDAMTDDDAAWGHWVEAFRRWHGLWVERGFIQMFRALLVESGAQRRLLALLDGERRMTNLLHLAELLHTAASREHLGPAGVLRWFQQQRTGDFTMSEAVKLRLERDDEAVQLITIHRSKGLEYPVVFCPYGWDPDELRRDEEEYLLYHNPDRDNRLELDIRPKPSNVRERRSDPAIARARFEQSAESLRLLYVALTRARHRCVVVWGAFDRAHHSALGYLLHAPELDSDSPWDRDLIDQSIKAASDERMLEWIERRKSPTWNVRFLHDVTPRPQRPVARDQAPLACREPRASLDRLWRTASFTQMTSKRARALPGAMQRDVDLGRDRDESSHASPTDGSEGFDDAQVPLATFPRGAKAGILFHDILEHLDFRGPAQDRRTLIETKLQAYGYATPDTIEQVDGAIQDILATPLDRSLSGISGPCPLGDIARTQRLDELEFVFPIADGESSLALGRESLASTFGQFPEGLPRGYARRLATLPFPPLRGFLKGFIDLCFVHDGRWYLVDYKSNHLGDTWRDYRPAMLSDVMAHEHYVLQYHLYVVALIRHLERRIRGFSYEHNFGGVLYLFLRGMSPDRGAEAGVYADRPPAARIAALSRLLSHPGVYDHEREGQS